MEELVEEVDAIRSAKLISYDQLHKGEQNVYVKIFKVIVLVNRYYLDLYLHFALQLNLREVNVIIV